MDTHTDFYEVLGVDKEASVAELKKAYYREARDSHPDKFPDDQKMQARFQAVADAYATLADPVRRQSYDLQGLAGLAYFKSNATRLFGPPPWRVLLGRTEHWLWDDDREEHFVGFLACCIPNGIAGVTMRTLQAAYEEARDTRVAVLLDRVTEEQAKDTVEQLEEYGIAVKAEPIEGERKNEKESPLLCFRRLQRELGEATETLRQKAQDIGDASGGNDIDFDRWVELVRGLRSELRAAAKGFEEFKLSKTS